MFYRLFLLVFMLLGVVLHIEAQNVQKFTSSPGAPISEASVARDTINVTSGGTVTDVKVDVNISHSHSGDLRITLTHQQSGISILLLRWLNGPGFAFGCGSDGIVATFDDRAAGPMDAFDCSDNFDMIVTGSWQPTQPLSSFNGVPMSGAWTIEVADAVRGDNGTLNSWSLTLNDVNAPDPEPPIGFNPSLVGGTPDPQCRFFDGSRDGAVLFAQIPDDQFGIYCRIIAEDGFFLRPAQSIGNNAVLEQGVVHAVDVYSPAGSTGEGSIICLRGRGSLIYLSAANSPRQPQSVAGVYDNGYTCMSLPYVGTVVFIGDGSASSVGRVQRNVVTGSPLSDCRVTTTQRLRFRSEPNSGSRTLTVLSPNITLTATARLDRWFQVTYLRSTGWVSAGYVTTDGNCN